MLRFAGPALLLAALILAACQSAPPPAPVAQVSRPGAARGIDLPTDASDVIGELRGSGIDFVARYYRDPASRWPALSPSEAQRVSALGLKLVTVWEWHSHDPAYFTYAAGYNDALNAYRQARTVGQPPGSAVYFAVDFNARGDQLPQVDQYFRGVAAGFYAASGGRPEYKVGVYGSGAVCAAVRGAGLAQYAWLSGSTSWYGSQGYNSWNIKQAAQGARFAHLSFSHDANEAREDYGGFQLGNYANTTTPAAAVVTAAATAPAVAATLVSGAVAAVVAPAAATPAATPPAPVATASAAASPVPVAAAVSTPPPVMATAPAPVVATTAPARPVAAPAAIAPAVPPAPALGSAAAEVAALAAAEPPVRSAAAIPARVVVPESTRSARLSPERAEIDDEPPPARTSTHAAARSAPKRKGDAVRSASVSPRRAGGSASAETRRPEHRASATRRAEERGASGHVGRAEAAHDRPARHNAERRRPERPAT